MICPANGTHHSVRPAFRLGLCQRHGYPAPGTGQRCGRTPSGGTQSAQTLDQLAVGRHTASCTKNLPSRRHNRIRDLLAKLARQAGLTATTEQAMLIPDQITPDGQPAPGSGRPIHRTDVHIIEPAGSELWLDVKIHTVAPDLTIPKELLREEQTKCRAYGQEENNLQVLDKGMTPIALRNPKMLRTPRQQGFWPQNAGNLGNDGLWHSGFGPILAPKRNPGKWILAPKCSGNPGND